MDLTVLLFSAASIGFFHTLLGPDHYLPFVVLAKAKKWSATKTALVTFWCGVGHVSSSVLLGFLGILLGVSVERLELLEGLRGDFAAWFLIVFGFVYFVWSLKKFYRNERHTHTHFHENGTAHVHEHKHETEHLHLHEKTQNTTPWVLFTVFVFGPCEPLIPVLMFPAFKHDFLGVFLVSFVFGSVTIATMLGVVLTSIFGINLLPSGKLEKYTHVFAGATICFSGLAIVFLGL